MTRYLSAFRRSPASWAGGLVAVLMGGSTVLVHGALPAGPHSGSTQGNAIESKGSNASIATLEARLGEIRAQLAAIGDADVTNAPAGIPQEDFWMRRAALGRLARLYEQQLSNAGTLEKARERRTAITREAQAWTRFPEPPPYSILLTDRLREEIQTEQQKIKTSEAAGAVLTQLIEENRRSLEQSEEKIRQLNEQMETAGDAAATARLSWERELERLRSQVAAGSIGVLDSERLIGEEMLGESRVRLGLLRRQLVFASAGATFTQSDLEQVATRLERQRVQLERELREAQERRVTVGQALIAAREKLGQATTPVAAEELAAREAQLETVDAAVRVTRLMLEGTDVELTMWKLRFATHEDLSVEKLRESAARLDSFKRRLGLWRDHERQQLELSSAQVELQEARLNGLPLDSELRLPAQARVAALRERDQLHLRTFRSIEGMHRLTERWAEGLRAAEGKLPLTGRVQNLFSDTRSFFNRLWSFEVFSAEDTITVDGQKITGKRSVTIGKMVMAVAILALGIWLTGLITRLVEPVIVKRLKIEANQASLMRRWMRALMIACIVLFSLVSVKIPLTIFAFAGGALAIGLGFGMQTVLKNLVSGLILLFERPFRVGDVLDVGEQKGIVTSIGLRASVLQLWDGTETLIPNSSLLENNVTNWTYSNPKVRFSVSVGVAYGTDPRRVMHLLNDVADRHGLVQKDPKPQVLFMEFGDSTLLFELRFWVDVSAANAAQVASDLRLMIAGAFAENGIVIDFPQQDVHLHASSPVPVQVMPAPAPAIGETTIPARSEGGDKPRVMP